MPEQKPELDFEKIGLKSGLEVHQQLETRKLFCNCPSVLRKDEPDFIVKRRLHAVAGESGEIDVAAAHEVSMEREFSYECYDTTCLVELDEEPCHEINQEALKIALQISLLLNAKIFPITQIMRKTVVDGSNTSGFQRTVMIARDGFIETQSGRVGIASICLEEDSARIVGEKGGEKIAVYRLDRLGIPLIEIATEPEIKHPSQAKEVALHMGEVLRSVKVKRGLGTIRQDVNLSVKGGKRVELKGFQDIRNIERAMETEVKRQIELVKKGKSVAEVRAVNEDSSSRFLRPMPTAARMYPETDLPLLKISRDFLNEAKKTLPDTKEREEIEGLSIEMTKLLFKHDKLSDFKELLQIINDPNLVAKTLLIYPKEIAAKEKMPLEKIQKILNKDVLANVLENLKKEKISEGQLKHVLTRITLGESFEPAEKKETFDAEEKIMNLVKSKPGLSLNAYMGLVMKEFQGKISGKEAAEIIKKYVK